MSLLVSISFIIDMNCKPVNSSFYLCFYKDHTTEGHCEHERLEYSTIQCRTRYVVVIN